MTGAPEHDGIDVVVGAAIRRLRTRRGLSIADLAEATGATSLQLSRIETGSARAGAHLLVSLAQALGVMPASFLPCRTSQIQLG